MSQKPLISVIVPVYNGQDYLEGCINSIENQTYPSLEIILINDGSTDDTAQVAKRLQEKYSNLKVITMCDEGVSAARNAGLNQMQGQFFMFVDADDRIYKDAIEMLYDEMEKTGCDIAGFRFDIFTEMNKWDEARTSDKEAVFTHYNAKEYLEKQMLNGNSRCWSKLYRTSSVGQLRFKEGLSIGEDMLYVLDGLSEVHDLAETDAIGYAYYRNPKGAMLRSFSPRYMDQITCWELAEEKAKAIVDDKAVQAKLEAIQIQSILLVAGKIAVQSKEGLRQCAPYVDTCKEKMKAKLSKETLALLDRSYQVKAMLFYGFPKLYMWLYHCLAK